MATSMHTRIRLKFDDFSENFKPNPPHVWYLVNPSDCLTISDLISSIHKKFSLPKSLVFSLDLDGFHLPPCEKIHILQNGDVLNVKSSAANTNYSTPEDFSKASRSKCVEDFCDLEPCTKRNHRKGGSKRKFDDYNESDESSDSENHDAEISVKRLKQQFDLKELIKKAIREELGSQETGSSDVSKKQKKRRHEESDPEKSQEDKEDKAANTSDVEDSDSAPKKKKKERKKHKKDKTEDKDKVETEKNVTAEDKDKGKGAGKKDKSEDNSVKRKKKDRDSSESKDVSCSSDKDKHKISSENISSEKDKERRYRDKKGSSDKDQSTIDKEKPEIETLTITNVEDSNATSSNDTNIGDPNKKRTRIRRRKSRKNNKSEINDTQSTDISFQSNNSVNSFLASTPLHNGHATASPCNLEPRSRKNGHIIFGDEDDNDGDCKNSSGLSDVNFNAGNTPFAVPQLNRSARKALKRKSNFNLSKDDQLNDKQTNKSFILSSPKASVAQNGEVINGSSEFNNHDLNESETVIDYELEETLLGMPRISDHLAFKILELSEDFTPRISDYKTGEVMYVEAENTNVHIKLHVLKTKIENKKNDSATAECEDDIIIVPFSNFISPKLLKNPPMSSLVKQNASECAVATENGVST